MEEWKDIKGFEGLYQVSSFGNIKSKKGLLKPIYHHTGYYKVNLHRGGKRKEFLIHRLVAEHFLVSNPLLTQVNHKDENKSNNHVDNLEWCDGGYNTNYGTCVNRRRATYVQKFGRAVQRLNQNGVVVKRYNCIADVAKDGFRPNCVVEVAQGKHFLHKGYRWEYCEKI